VGRGHRDERGEDALGGDATDSATFGVVEGTVGAVAHPKAFPAPTGACCAARPAVPPLRRLPSLRQGR
jgi:hypothetical protein